MSTSALTQVIEQYHRAVDAFVRGDPEPQKRLFSRRDDVTLANPVDPPARGWHQVEATMERAAAQLRDGEPCTYERISGWATADLGYVLEIQRTRAKFGGADELTPVALRVTTIFRREDGAWRVVHRHADPITALRPPSADSEA
jgi:ketosteroid isomerase-like protein